MIPNPKRQVVVEFNHEKVKQAINKIPVINSNYKLESSNDVMKITTLSAFELLSLGVFIDITYKPIAESTEITIEVRRKVGSFDEPYEVSNANNHIQVLLTDISELLVNPDMTKSSNVITTEKSNSKLWGIIAWVIGLLILFAAPSSQVPIVNVVIFLLLINKTLRNLYSKYISKKDN